MSEDVKRYFARLPVGPTMHRSGDWVSSEDYDALERELTQARGELSAWHEAFLTNDPTVAKERLENIVNAHSQATSDLEAARGDNKYYQDLLAGAAEALATVERERDGAYARAAKRMEELAQAWGRNTPYACEKHDSYSLAAAECRALASQPTPQAGEE